MVNLRINQIFSTGAVRNARRMNQNQRYEVRMDFPGYECRMAFPGSAIRLNTPFTIDISPRWGEEK